MDQLQNSGDLSQLYKSHKTHSGGCQVSQRGHGMARTSCFMIGAGINNLFDIVFYTYDIPKLFAKEEKSPGLPTTEPPK
jgi:hypothetical protein